MPLKLSQITHDKVLLVEGQDEVNFFQALLNHLHLVSIQIIELGGKDRFHNEFPTFLALPGFEQLTAYAIIRDADSSHTSTLHSIKDLLQRNGQPCPANSGEFTTPPRKVGVFIIPGNTEQGMLESLCLRSVSEHPAMPCVESFMRCLDEMLEKRLGEVPINRQQAYYPKNEEKAKTLAFLSCMHEVTTSIGLAAQKGYWPFDHTALAELRNFLIGL